MTSDLRSSPEIPDCDYPSPPTLIPPQIPTQRHTIPLSNIDSQKFLRFSIKYLYLYEHGVSVERLKLSLSRVLSEYYPFAGRLRACEEDDSKVEVDCNGEGALFIEGFLGLSVDEFMEVSGKPNKSWRKLVYRVENVACFLDLPPLVVQVTNLRCGGMLLSTSINHCLCDGVGTSQFLHAWAHLTTNQNPHLSIMPIHTRHVLNPRTPPKVTFTHLGFTHFNPTFGQNHHFAINKYLQSQPLVTTSITFNPSQILTLKRKITPSLKCTTFETLASHTWKSWVRSLNLSYALDVKLLFSVNIRKRVKPELPDGYYGNGFVLGCAKSNVKELVTNNLHYGVKLVQHAKSSLDNECIRSMVDQLEAKNVEIDLSTSLVISQWSKLGLEDLDFGTGKPLHMGPVTSDVYCLFLPVVGDIDSIRVLVSLPQHVAERFAFYMTEILDIDENVESNGSILSESSNQLKIELSHHNFSPFTRLESETLVNGNKC